MGPAEMVVAIVGIGTVGSIIRARYGYRKFGKTGDRDTFDAPAAAENRLLTDEVRGLKERIQVLERLATEDTEAKRIDREIEKLRDRSLTRE